jgi:hypothetical protein
MSMSAAVLLAGRVFNSYFRKSRSPITSTVYGVTVLAIYVTIPSKTFRYRNGYIDSNSYLF